MNCYKGNISHQLVVTEVIGQNYIKGEDVKTYTLTAAMLESRYK